MSRATETNSKFRCPHPSVPPPFRAPPFGAPRLFFLSPNAFVHFVPTAVASFVPFLFFLSHHRTKAAQKADKRLHKRPDKRLNKRLNKRPGWVFRVQGCGDQSGG